MKPFFRLALLGLALSGGIAGAAPNGAKPAKAVKPDPIEAAFRAGNASMEKRDYAEALKRYRIVLAAQPDDPSALFNAGSAAFFVGEFPAAATYFERLQKQEPNDGALLAKRIQTAQELGDLKARDALREQIFALRASGEDASGYTQKPFFCRDQFFVGKDQVLAMEYWTLAPLEGNAEKPYLGRVYEFYVVAPDDDETKIRIETGWSLLQVNADGTFAPAPEMPAFYYDAYYASGPWARRTFGLLPDRPTYEAAKEQAIAIVKGRATQVSGRKRGEKGGSVVDP